MTQSDGLGLRIMRYRATAIGAQFSIAAAPVRLARSFAQKHVVDVWYSENGANRLLEAYRPRVAPQAERREA